MPPGPENFSPPQLQPHLHRETVTLRAPTQVWSAADGSIGASPIHGVYHSDIRVLSGLAVQVGGAPPQPVASDARTKIGQLVSVSLLRHLDDDTDSTLRSRLDRTVQVSSIFDRLTLSSRRTTPVDVEVEVTLVPDLTSIDRIKAGLGSGPTPRVTVTGDSAHWSGPGVEVSLRLPDAYVVVEKEIVRAKWSVTIPAFGEVSLGWGLSAADSRAVVAGVDRPAPWNTPTVGTADSRLGRWVSRSLQDLESLLLTTGSDREALFLGAGAPWFLTLFGRDSLWAARMLLPLGTDLAAGTLSLLADMQGSELDLVRAEEPGKILHELRRHDHLPTGGENGLPPLYYGTVDATPLWVNVLADAWRWGLPAEAIEPLLPHLEAALAWMQDYGDADGDGLLEYIDVSGRGLSNQGWKDSGDSVQWRDGTFAEGPIALVEVQGYAYEAALAGAEMLERFGRRGSDRLREWADTLKGRFHTAFWIEDETGPYPAIALDASKRAVDSLTSNIGHLLGTGILDADQAATVVDRLCSPELDSGFGLRTLSSSAAGYWPLSYHGGSVWPHDTAIVIAGMVREGHGRKAASLIQGLLAAAEGFDYRLPELYSGDDRRDIGIPVPYPAACRPQAWSAASSVAVLAAVLGLQPTLDGLVIHPGEAARGAEIDGLVFRGESLRIRVDQDGLASLSPLDLQS